MERLPKDIVNFYKEIAKDMAVDLVVSRNMVKLLPEGNELREFHVKRVTYLEGMFGIKRDVPLENKLP